MSKAVVKDISSCEKLLTVEVPAETVKREYDAVYAEIAAVAKVPGFRPGKAPREVVARHYKDDARERVLKRLLPSSLRDALASREIQPITSPSIERLEFDADKLTYDAHIEVRPKIKLDRYKRLKVRSKQVVVEESEIDQVVKQLQDAHARLVPVEDRDAAMNDFLVCDYTCNVDGKEVEKRSDDTILLKEKEYLEGFSSQLVGVKAGETRSIRVKFPENYTNQKQAGKEAMFEVAVKEIKMRQLLDLGDDLAKACGNFATLAELRAKVREQIDARKQAEREAEIEKALLGELLKQSRFEVPTKMVERRRDVLLEEAIHTMRHQGLQEEAVEKEKESMREKLKPDAERQIRISFLVGEISAREKIEAQEADYQVKYEAIAARFHKPVEEIKSYFEGEDGKKDSLELQVISEKVIQFLKDHAVIETK